MGAKPLTFLMEQNHRLGKAKRSFLTHPESYHHLVACLIYLTFTRPDLAYSLQVLSQFMHQPRQDHWMPPFVFFDISRVLRPRSSLLSRFGFTTLGLLWLRLSQLSRHSPLSYQFLCFLGPLSYFLEIKETTYHITLLHRGRICLHGRYLLQTKIVALLSSLIFEFLNLILPPVMWQ